jgi:ABC-type oligopeptide transport system substrate-binding subunit
MNMAIDKQLIMDKIFNGSRDPAHSVVPPNLGGRDDVCPSWNYDPVAAKALWDAAGPIDSFAVWFNEGGGHEEWVGAIVNMWVNVLGVDAASLQFETRPWADYLSTIQGGDGTGPFRLGWGQDYPSPLNFLEPLYASYGGSNSSFYDNPEFDALIAEGKAAIAASGLLADAVPFYEAAEDVLCDDGSSIPVYFTLNQFAWNDTVSDVFMDAFGNVRFTSVKADSGVASLPLTEPVALLPMDVLESEGNQVTQNTLFTGLISFGPDMTQGLGNAASFTTDDGGLNWTVVLKDGWNFHNGEPVTAQSYVDAWSFGAVAAYGFQNNFFYSIIAGYDELNAG